MTMTLDGTNGVTFFDTSLQGAAASPFGLKNRIINGAMVIDQRNAGASVTQTATGGYCVDRWTINGSITTKFTAQQNAAAVTPPTGFTNYLGVTSSSSYTLLAGDYFYLMQGIEGFNVSDLDCGTATAKTVTLSFWVRSSLTGTFGGTLRNLISGATRSYPFTYTISVANTWELKSVTIAGDTSGTWATGSGNSLTICFSMGTGSTYSGTAGAWAGSNLVSATGATSVVSTNGATWYVTGVQLEAGSTATPFERRLYNQELANCQRYCVNYRSADSGSPYFRYGVGQCETTTGLEIVFPYPVPMRVLPTLTTTGTAANYGVYHSSVVTAFSSVPTINNSSSYLNATINGVVASGLTQGRACALLSNNNNTSYLLFSAEL